MGCTNDDNLPSDGLHICWRKPSDRSMQSGTCLDCKKRTWFIRLLYDWEGWYSTCIKCGRQWFNGDWQALEFSRNSRRDNIESAKYDYRSLKINADSQKSVTNR